MLTEYQKTVKSLEALQIMPKSMPGLEKIKKALAQTKWWKKIDPLKVIVVAGTNGKGTTCAALEALLLSAGLNVGFYSSPHLVSTAERIRVNGSDISEDVFVNIYQKCEALITTCELSHFEALTLMAADYFFSEDYHKLDYVILEVGLGGAFDATNAFPHKYSVITSLGIDHIAILGNSLEEIAQNKFGIVTKKGIVVHHQLPKNLFGLKQQVQRETNSNWIESHKGQLIIDKANTEPQYFIQYEDLKIALNLPGRRACENIMTAITLFEILGFDLRQHFHSISQINWRGRMQKISISGFKCPVYLSGDHNLQGAQSLVNILHDFEYERLHLIVGIGLDKQVADILNCLLSLKNVDLYLTETPFKGCSIDSYPEEFIKISAYKNSNISEVLSFTSARADANDICVVSGSLYLVGEVLKLFPTK